MDDLARKRLTQVFEYLRALHQHRNPAVRQVQDYPWTLSLRDLPVHESVLRGWLEGEPSAEEVDARSEDPVPGDAFILRVRRPSLTSSPPPPEPLAGWVDADLKDPASEPQLRALAPLSPTIDGESEEATALRLERERQREAEHRERERVFAQWLNDRWLPWTIVERPARAAMKVFDALYDVHGRLQREAERVELVVGDGMLSWRQAAGGVHHPILLQRLQLEFDPEVPQFTLVEADHPVEFYSGIGQAVPSIPADVLVESREELDQAPVHPLSTGAADEYLKRLVNRLSPSSGAFLGPVRITGESQDPRISRDPYIFLRSRALGFGMALDRILEDLKGANLLPHPILGAVGIETAHPDEGNGGG